MIKDYELILYNTIIKPLVLSKPDLKVYKNAINEDYDSRPDDFIVYQAGMSDKPVVYGDGKVLIRRCSCDITVNEAGDGNNENAGYLVRMLEDILQEKNIHYTKVALGYIEALDSMQTTLDFNLI